MDGDGKCLKLFHALILMIILLHCFKPSLSSEFNNISSEVVTGHKVMRCITGEREALLTFKQGLVDHYNLLSSWGREAHNQDCCKWFGVQCHNRTGRITQLDLGWRRVYQAYSLQQKGDLEFIKDYLQGKTMSPKLIELHHLKYLDLTWINFNGSQLPDFIGSLSNLRHLDLRDVFFGGRFPSQVGNLTHLQFLDLSGNEFTNAKNLNSWLPHLFSLTYLDLSWNNLNNVYDWLEIVNKLPKLTNLTLNGCVLPPPLIHSSTLSNINSSNSLAHVDLSFNSLSYSSLVFPWLSKYNANLEYLNLYNNHLTGLFPDVIGNMSSLAFLDLSFNQFEGMVSENHFSNLSRLTYLDLSSNSLTLNFRSDWIPPFQLEFIYLGSCKIGPHFPKWLQTQRNYEWLDISNAGISDILPSWLWERLSDDPEIYEVDLSNNQIRGTIPNPIVPDRLNLSWNQLEGPIPSFLSTSYYLDLSNNKLSGSISFLCPNKVSNLAFLDLSSNNLSEQLPNCWTHFINLAFLDLNDNSFLGKIPTTMGSLCSIQTLKLNSNAFVGELPSSLMNCTRLVVFDVGENQLSGLIPEWLGVGLPNLTILILRSNHLNGSIPLQWCNMTGIHILDFSMNNISGSIPKCLNNFTNLARRGSSSLTVDHFGYSVNFNHDEVALIWNGILSKYKSTLGLVKSIHLSSNQLTGEIPNEITDLVGLVSLNLSRNNLTGQITPEIGKLQSLDLLDLSNNQIHGTIPKSLFGISGLGKLDLSNNNLSGEIPMGSLLQNYDSSVFGGNPLLCGIPLQRCSPEETSLEERPVFREQVEDKDGLITSGFYVSLALGFIVGFWGVCGSLIFIRSWRYTYYKFLNCVYDWVYVRVALIRRRRLVDG